MSTPRPPRPPRTVLPNPGITENGKGACNEPLIVNGETVAYCQRLVKLNHRGRRRGTHRGAHRLEWWSG